MRYSVEKEDKYCLLRLEDEKLNSQNAPMLKSEMILLNTEGYKNIILDLSPVKYVDSSGLSAILICDRLCRNSGGVFVLAGAGEQVRRLLQISQLDQVIHLLNTSDESKDFVLMHELENELREPDQA
ncbi:MAG: STAS domain-containing protein [Chitinophagales bacterium]|nr:STAS domain-containing protein [Chitinophagales bacterium]MDW8428710.1 STAS domain-containing protein [Chitinophagales bacterium]